MEKNHHLFKPLLNTPLDDEEFNNLNLISSNSGIIFRLSLIVFIGILSIWANHEASKGYSISIVNESPNTAEGKQFQLFYVSNDKATRILIKESMIVENFLYPAHMESYTKKPINHIILKLASKNLTNNVVIESKSDHEFVLNINPYIMKSTNFGHTMFLAALREGVARIWLWDAQGNAPKNLIDGVVEYLSSKPDRAEPPRLAAVWWKHCDPRTVAQFLGYYESQHEGYIRRLNQAMKDEWHDGKLDDQLGQPVKNLCTINGPLMYNFSSV